MNGRWVCKKCNSWTTGEKNRCSFCSEPRPIVTEEADTDATEMDKLTKRLHNIVEGLTPLQKKKTFRYFEDNFL